MAEKLVGFASMTRLEFATPQPPSRHTPLSWLVTDAVGASHASVGKPTPQSAAVAVMTVTVTDAELLPPVPVQLNV
jgi:hypothetical protein